MVDAPTGSFGVPMPNSSTGTNSTVTANSTP